MNDLWPCSEFKWTGFRPSPMLETLEEKLSRRFSGLPCVLFSSGRSGLFAILKNYEIMRGDSVWLPPFSSHCVFNTVAYLGDPQSVDPSHVKFQIVYHQWGYEKRRIFSNATVIEDSVDTFPGDAPKFFPNDGDYEIFSLPKILGNQFGGVVVCRNKASAENLRKVRGNMRKMPFIHNFLRVIGAHRPNIYAYWNASESLSGNIPGWVRGDIQSGIDRWDEIAEIRKKNVRIAKMAVTEGYLEPVNEHNRLPCAFKLKGAPPTALASSFIFRREYDFSESGVKIHSVHLLPAHHQVSPHSLNIVLSNLLESGSRK